MSYPGYLSCLWRWVSRLWGRRGPRAPAVPLSAWDSLIAAIYRSNMVFPWAEQR